MPLLRRRPRHGAAAHCTLAVAISLAAGIAFGTDVPQLKIVGGAAVPFQGTYPWLVALDLYSINAQSSLTAGAFCTGTLVSPTAVMTAAHCLVRMPAL